LKQIVAIVGRPNVGKSTLFNRIIGKQKALVKNEPGVTRDLNYADVFEQGRAFTLIDTGGFEPESKETMLIKVREQALLAVEEADIIIFLMDGREGFLSADRDIADVLRRADKKLIYAVNKIDTDKQEQGLADFYALGAEDLAFVSAEQGRGVYELLDKIINSIPKTSAKEEGDRIKLAVTGRPNVGKSSLVNKLLGYERVMVSNTPGTTRDAIDTDFNYNKKHYLLIDTAGIRKKTRIARTLEKYSVVSTIKTIERCDIALLIIDANDGLTEQDEKIAGLAYERGKGCIIVVNKY